ncbi:MAG: TraR/DksA family transcriptional regulator [Candidatus Aminicenantes bacterium]|nr:MAG: TraR/DksA family transcriptional regulator [Candidatus Aminicenantes bacterium]
MNKKERERYRNKLLKKKEEIVNKISETYNESKEVESGIAQDVVDKAESSYTKEFLLSLSDAEREQLLLIDEALKRIDKKELGICQRCGKDINKKRLDAVPWTSYCIDCQEIEEEESS